MAGEDDDKTVVVAPSHIAGVKLPAPKARLLCLDESLLSSPEGKEILLTGKELTVGRGDDNDVPIKAQSISRVHAKILPGDGVWGLEDLGSTNGVHVNDKTIHQTWLKHKDQVVIGKVPYEYLLDQPEIGAAVEPEPEPEPEPDFDPAATMVDKTMMVTRDSSAAAALLRSAAKDRTEPLPKRQPAPAHQEAPSGATPTAVEASPAKGGKTKLIIGAVTALLLIVGAAGYFLLSGGGERKALIADLQAKTRDFHKSYGRPGADHAPGNMAEELRVVGQLGGQVQAGLDKFPTSPELLSLNARISFYEAERKLRTAIAEGGLGKVYQELNATLSKQKQAIDAYNTGGEPVPKDVLVIQELTHLAVAVSMIKLFVLRFPEATLNAGEVPQRDLLDKVLKLRRSFASLKKKHNLALSVDYPYFGDIVAQTDELDIRLLDKWNRVLR